MASATVSSATNWCPSLNQKIRLDRAYEVFSVNVSKMRLAPKPSYVSNAPLY